VFLYIPLYAQHVRFGEVPTGISKQGREQCVNIVFADEAGEVHVMEPANEQVVIPVTNTGGHYERTDGVTPVGTTGYSRQVPWGVGKIAGQARDMETFRSSREAMTAHGLDWEVIKGPLHSFHNGEAQPLDEWMTTQRADTGKVLGIVKGSYAPMQNRRLAEFTDTLIETGSARPASMGSAFDDRKVYTVVALDDIDSPDGGLGTFLITANSHDGSSSMYTTLVNVRWACVNGLVALSDKAHTVKVRHSGQMEVRLHEAQRVMASASDYLEDTTRIMDELLATPIGDFNKLITTLVPTPTATKDNKRAVDNAHKRQAEIAAVLHHSDNLADVRGTGWGFVNAVAEWNEWTGSHVKRRKLTPMERLLNDSTHDIVRRAQTLVLA
jgi:phage/plasmid-like protein (TIGR03299 family)